MRLHIGVDPGQSGGLAALQSDGSVYAAYAMPATIREILDVLGHWSSISQATGVLEFVHAMPKQGVSSTFKFGKSAGVLECALEAAGISFSLVTPKQWQGALECRTKGDKRVSLEAAARLFPGARVNHAIADALLLAEYGRRLGHNRRM